MMRVLPKVLPDSVAVARLNLSVDIRIVGEQMSRDELEDLVDAHLAEIKRVTALAVNAACPARTLIARNEHGREAHLERVTRAQVTRLAELEVLAEDDDRR